MEPCVSTPNLATTAVALLLLANLLPVADSYRPSALSAALETAPERHRRHRS
ncbi:hypothetical protein [Hymenobacter pini]|uniref:hypothetical protein n=1 Tax=Hymenobacter pini TaxID=2880879 RepID=UPI001CF5C883|nr:hypothetical protein [Hymenobacter pini]MCA8829762.1 hypothetical protein [Hymenobacter pini]